jgi:hypothetical protein
VEFVEELVGNGDQEPIFSLSGVFGPVVNAKAPSLVLLLDEEHW